VSGPWTDCVCDLETGGVDPGRSMVLQIAAVKWNRNTGEVSSDFFDRCILPQPTRSWSESTREFWMKRRDVLESIMARMEDRRVVIAAFNDWVGQDQLTFWGKPTHFDFSFLQSFWAENDSQIPFHYRSANDMNSFARGVYHPEEPPKWERIIPFEGPEHNALFDCFHQLKVITKIMNKEKPDEA